MLAQWARVRPDLDTAPLALAARLGRASAYVDGWIDAGLAEFGVSRPSWDVLASLRRSGPPHRLSPTELYRGLMRTSGAISHRLSRLETAGLIRRVVDPEDRRSLLVELTSDGLALADRIAPVHLENERRMLSVLDPDEQRALTGLLRKLVGAFEREQPMTPPWGSGGRRRRGRRGHGRRGT